MAGWLAGLIQQAIDQLEHNPGLTIEIEGSSRQWIQLIPEQDEEEESRLGGFVINFPYRERIGDPLAALHAAGLAPPPGTQVVAWEDNGYAMIWLRPDVPLIALALFIGDVLERIVGAAEGYEVSVQIEHGF